jgi:hypothetical protein
MTKTYLKQDQTRNKNNTEKLTWKIKTKIQEIKGYNLINGAKL